MHGSFVGYWSTIRLTDVNGDGKADLCARGPRGITCHLSNGSGFGPAVDGPAWSDSAGWSRHRYYSTLRFADIDGDGDLDVCGRAAKGIVCAPWEGAGFGSAFNGPALSDTAGWGALRFYQTIRFLDLDGDRRADLCARTVAGVRCHLSQGRSFGAEIVGPEWSDAKNWDEPRYFSTIRGAGPRCLAAELCGNGHDDDCNGQTDDGCGAAGGGGGGGSSGSDSGAGGGAAGKGGSVASGGSSGKGGGSSGGGSGGDASTDEASDASGCGCRGAGSAAPTPPPIGAIVGLALALCRRRRRRPRESLLGGRTRATGGADLRHSGYAGPPCRRSSHLPAR